MSSFDTSKSKPWEVPAGYPPASPSFSGSVHQGASVRPPVMYEVENRSGFYGGSSPTQNWGGAEGPNSGIIRPVVDETDIQETEILLKITTLIGIVALVLLLADMAVAFSLETIYNAIVDLILLLGIPIFWFFGVKKLISGMFSAFLTGVFLLLVWKIISFVLVCIKLRTSRFKEFDITVVMAAFQLALILVTLMWLHYILKLFRKLAYPAIRRQRAAGTGIETGGLPPPAFSRDPVNAATTNSTTTGSYAYNVGGDAVVLGKTISTS